MVSQLLLLGLYMKGDSSKHISHSKINWSKNWVSGEWKSKYNFSVGRSFYEWKNKIKKNVGNEVKVCKE